MGRGSNSINSTKLKLDSKEILFSSVFSREKIKAEKKREAEIIALEKLEQEPPGLTDETGGKFWFDKEDQLHRDNDLPAYIRDDKKQWFQHGKLHRDNDKPATVSSYSHEWYQHGKRHREGGPAIINHGRNEGWYLNGKCHRDDDLPAQINFSNGLKEWYQQDKRHRDGDRPAIVDNEGLKEWWQNDRRHRENGPAVIYPDGTKEWWKNGVLQSTHSEANLATSYVKPELNKLENELSQK